MGNLWPPPPTGLAPSCRLPRTLAWRCPLHAPHWALAQLPLDWGLCAARSQRWRNQGCQVSDRVQLPGVPALAPQGTSGSLLSAANLCLGCRPEPRVERERKRRIPAPGCEAKGVIKRRVASQASEAGGSRANRVGPSAPASCTRGPSREGQLPGRARPSHLLHTSQVSVLPQERPWAGGKWAAPPPPTRGGPRPRRPALSAWSSPGSCLPVCVS